MEWLRHNFIADMPGSEFLVLYVLAIAAAHVVCWQWRQLSDGTAQHSLPLVPKTPDPFEIAYLRGGAIEVWRLALLSLLQRGFLRIVEPPKRFSLSTPPSLLQQAATRMPAGLSRVEQRAWEWCAVPRTFMTLSLPYWKDQAESWCAPLKAHLEIQNLLAPPALKNAMSSCRWWCAGSVLALGAYKLADALNEGRNNIGFLIILMIVTAVSFALLPSPRLTARGRAYLKQLEIAFSNLRTGAVSVGSPFGNSSTASAGAPAGSADLLMPTLLAVSIFGAVAMQNAAFADYRRLYPPQSGSGSSCGSGGGCSSSSDGGSSDSGGSSCGGGGCGGGGCGGG